MFVVSSQHGIPLFTCGNWPTESFVDRLCRFSVSLYTLIKASDACSEFCINDGDQICKFLCFTRLLPNNQVLYFIAVIKDEISHSIDSLELIDSSSIEEKCWLVYVSISLTQTLSTEICAAVDELEVKMQVALNQSTFADSVLVGQNHDRDYEEDPTDADADIQTEISKLQRLQSGFRSHSECLLAPFLSTLSTKRNSITDALQSFDSRMTKDSRAAIPAAMYLCSSSGGKSVEYLSRRGGRRLPAAWETSLCDIMYQPVAPHDETFSDLEGLVEWLLTRVQVVHSIQDGALPGRTCMLLCQIPLACLTHVYTSTSTQMAGRSTWDTRGNNSISRVSIAIATLLPFDLLFTTSSPSPFPIADSSVNPIFAIHGESVVKMRSVALSNFPNGYIFASIQYLLREICKCFLVNCVSHSSESNGVGSGLSMALESEAGDSKPLVTPIPPAGPKIEQSLRRPGRAVTVAVATVAPQSS